jgi:rubrerythrin
MQPTSEERREVAERLRDCIVYAKKHDLNGDCDMGSDKCVETRNTLYNDIASCIEEYGNFNLSAEQVFTRLADLIDPTCHRERKRVVVDDYRRDTLILPVCSACGFTFDKRMPKPNFCPHCGARLVERGDD